MDKSFQFKIVTPHNVVFEDSVSHIQAPGTTGYFGIKTHHLPYLTSLATGKITAELKGGTKTFATSGGFAEVINNQLTIIAESAEEASAIDVGRAQISRDRALKRLQQRQPDLDTVRAEQSLLRALNRLELASTRNMLKFNR